MENTVYKGKTDKHGCLPWVFPHGFERGCHGEIEVTLLFIHPQNDMRKRSGRFHGDFIGTDAQR